MEWKDLVVEPPSPDEHDRVLIYTRDHDFAGEKVFDVKTDTLSAHHYIDLDEQPEVCRHATHWAARPDF